MSEQKLKLLKMLLEHTEAITIRGNKDGHDFEAELDDESFDLIRDLVLEIEISKDEEK